MRCSVIIPTWRRPAALRETLESLLGEDEPEFEVIVVSDGDDPETRALAGEFTTPYELRWIFHERNSGLPAARNSGANAAQGDILLFLDDDTPVGKGFIRNHSNAHPADSPFHYAACGRTIESPQESPQSATDRFLLQSCLRTVENCQFGIGHQGPESVGANFEKMVYFGLNCSIRRDVFHAHGGFNRELRLLDEETEFGLRLYRAGILFVFLPTAKVLHHNVKSLTRYYRRCWHDSAITDAQRVFNWGQRNPQTSKLLIPSGSSLPQRIAAGTLFHCAPAATAAEQALEWAANRTGSRLFYGAWARLCRPAQYWAGVRSAGCTLEQLKTAAGTPSRALALHSISMARNSEEERFCLSPQHFRRLLQWCRLCGFRWSAPDEWVRQSDPPNLLLTFDDGYEDLYEYLLPAVSEFRLKPLVFLVAEQIGKINAWDGETSLGGRRLLNLSQIREMAAAGIEFGSHSLTHPSLPDLSDSRLIAEVRDSRTRLEDLLGSPVRSFAYPFGALDQRVRSAVAQAGYTLAFTTRPGVNWWDDPLCLKRSEIDGRDRLLDIAFRIATGYGLRPWLGKRSRWLEEQAPGAPLRRAARAIHSMIGKSRP